jgi:hypothetical protein
VSAAYTESLVLHYLDRKPKYAPEDDVSAAYREFSIALPG